MFGHAWLRAAETVAVGNINDRPLSPQWIRRFAICIFGPVNFRVERLLLLLLCRVLLPSGAALPRARPYIRDYRVDRLRG